MRDHDYIREFISKLLLEVQEISTMGIEGGMKRH